MIPTFSFLLYFFQSVASRALLKAVKNSEIVLCDQNVSEFREIIRRKAPNYITAGEIFLEELPFVLIPAIHHSPAEIRDQTDQPILKAAMVFHVDMIITGDKDFLSLKTDRPLCISARTYLEEY